MATSPLHARFHLADYGKFIAIFALLLSLYAGRGLDETLGMAVPEAILYIASLAVCAAVLVFKPKWKAAMAPCSCCGKPCSPFRRTSAEALCPRCQYATLSPGQRRRVGSRALTAIVLLLLAATFVLTWPFSPMFGSWIGASDWIASPLFAVLVFTTSLSFVFALLVFRRVMEMRQLASPVRALAAARAAAGQGGEESALGQLTVHAFGTADPTSVIRDQGEIVRGRLAALLDAEVNAERPLRVYAFGQRDPFLRFLGRAGLNPGHLDGMYVPWAERAIVFSAETLPHRLTDTEGMLRTLVAYFELEPFLPPATATWLQVGVANVVTCGGDPQDLARLNRRILASLSNGTVFSGADLFHGDVRRLGKWLRGWDEFDNFRRLSQYYAQAWSVAEFLAGSGATAERREHFSTWLKALRPGEPLEPFFEQQFGYGFDRLLEDWKNWVVSQGTGRYELPSSHVREAVRGRLLPAIENPKTKGVDRILAIRDLGRTGDLGAAGVLIKLARTGGTDYAREAVASLESLSGLALGPDAGAWEAWWKGLPAESVESPAAR